MITKKIALISTILLVYTGAGLAMEDNNQKKSYYLTAEIVHEKLRIFTEHNLLAQAEEVKIEPTIHFFFTSNNNHLQNLVTHTSFETTKEAELAIQERCDKNKSMVWWVTPFTRPANMAALLQNNGFTPYPLAAMGCSINNIPDSTMQAYQEILSNDFQIKSENLTSSRKKYEIHCNNTQVSNCSVFIQDDWITLYNLHTQENMRKKGLATVLIARILKDMKKQGFVSAYMIAMPITVVIGKKFGFKQFGDINYYYKLNQQSKV